MSLAALNCWTSPTGKPIQWWATHGGESVVLKHREKFTVDLVEDGAEPQRPLAARLRAAAKA